MASTSDLRFPYFVLEWLKEGHPFFRYPILTHGDYEPYLHQAEVFYRLLPRSPVKFLIADDVGLGKTVEGIMIIDQLVKFRKVDRVLLILPRVLVKQWEYELSRFANEWRLAVKEYPQCDDLQSRIICVVSVDTFKMEEHLRKFLSVPWDLIIIDEIHKVGVTGGRETQRYSSVSRLVTKNPNVNLVGLSATPHKGDDEDYSSRLMLIDPYLIELKGDIISYTVRAIILKRTKDNVNKVYENAKIFPDAYFVQYLIEPNEDERKYYTLIRELALSILKDYYNAVNRPPRTLPLLSFIIGRRSLSSPRAGLLTFEAMIKKRSAELSGKVIEEEAKEYAESEEIEEDKEPDEMALGLASLNSELVSKYMDALSELEKLANKVIQNDSRLNQLVKLLDYHLKRGDKVIVFTEYKDTAYYIYEKVSKSLNLDDDTIKVVTSETLSKEGIESIKGWLNREGEKVLIATDVASEGLNLQSANVLIHYELPLSIVRFEQRNGRIWRLKQTKPVLIYYISLNTPIEQAILENYYNKLLSITMGTGSTVPTVDTIIYEKEGVHKVFNLNEEKENIPVYLGFEDVERKGEKITPLKVWESALEGKIDEVVQTIIRRVQKLKDSMRKFALYENPSRRVIIELDNVRRLAGFNDRNDLKAALDALTKDLVSKLGGKIVGDKIMVEGRVLTYSQERLGSVISVLYGILQRRARFSPSSYVVCDNLEYNVYAVDAVVSLGNSDVLRVPVVVDSNGNLIPLSEFVGKVLPQTLDCNGVYPSEVKLVSEIPNKTKIINQIRGALYSLEEQYVTYRSKGAESRMRGKDNWLPNKIEEIRVRLEVRGGIIGVKGYQEDVMDKVVEALKKDGWAVSPSGGKFRLERKGEVRYVEIVSPSGLLARGDGWRYSLVNGVLVGVKHGV